MIEDIKRNTTWEQTKSRADQIINTIQLQADFFKIKTRITPTVFISYDLFEAVLTVHRNEVTSNFEQGKFIYTICGYDLELITHGYNILYLGYSIMEDL